MKKLKCTSKRMWVYLLVFAMITASLNINTSRSNASAKKMVASISIVKPSVSSLTLKKGSSYRLKTKVSPKNAKNKKLKFKSSKSSVASVSSKGVIKAKKRGTVTIDAISTDKSNKKASVKVSVVHSLKR